MFNIGELIKNGFHKKLKDQIISPPGENVTGTTSTRQVEMSATEAKRLLQSSFKPNIYMIMKQLATGKYKRMGNSSGFQYHKNSNSPSMKAKRLRQIEKGMIQVTPEPKQPTQEVSNAG